LFAQHGYHAFSIRQIADVSGVPLALVGRLRADLPACDSFHVTTAATKK
jgi:hypothetical protein